MMIDLGLRRHRSPDRGRSTVTRWVGCFEVLESRITLSNGLVGVPAQFIAPPKHLVTISSVPEDPNNTGIVASTTVTAVGNVLNPNGGAISDFHTTLIIDAFENGTKIGEVSWDVTAGPGTITGPKYLGQDPSHQNEALFSLPFTLLSSDISPQNVTFQITAVGFGTRPVIRVDNQQTLTGTFVVNPAAIGLTVSQIAPITSPRTNPVQSVDVTFSKAIDPTTFTTADLTLTRDGAPVPLGTDVTFTTSNNITFSIGGLASSTTPLGAYVFTVDAAGVKDVAGNAGTGSKSVNFSVEAVAVDTGPEIVGLKRFGVHNQPTLIVLTFDRQLDPVTAGNLRNYRIYNPGHDRRIGTADDVLVPIFSGVYNSANRTVTLVMARLLNLLGQHRIVVKGTGPTAITDRNGLALDGAADGKPGSDFMTIFGREILVGVTPTGSTTTTTTTTKRIPTRAAGAGRYTHYQIGG